jgi:pimeloyl-ACP methyl ester carboxylesterase
MLRDAGHEVYTPSLTGLGERVHLASPQVDLSTHVADVVNHALYEDHRDVVLLGFSYGGMVVTGALDHIGDRVRHLVYLDAFVPADGQSLIELTGGSPPPFPPTGLGLEWLVPPTPRDFDDPAEGEFINARRVAHPVGCFAEPVRLSEPLEDWPFTRTYIRATADRADAPGNAAFERCAAHARTSPAWTLHEIATNHLVPSNRPRELADILLALA